MRRVAWVKVRLLTLVALLSFALGAVVRRAWILQIQRGTELRAAAEEQYLRETRLSPRRGLITDRNGTELAVSVDVDSVAANPRAVVDPDRTAQALAQVLGVEAAPLAQRLRSRRFFVWVKRRISPEESAAVRALGLAGVTLERESKRFYPNRELAAGPLGFVGADAVGLEGLELSFDPDLRGSAGAVRGIRDAFGRLVFAQQMLDDRGTAGSDVQTTLDRTLQYLAEQALAAAVNTFEARSGQVVIIDPASGEILAMANAPAFNANEYQRYTTFERRNRVVTDQFEPGSTFKIFTVAAALASGTLRADDAIWCERGLWTIFDYTVRDGHLDGNLNPTQILARSSNIGAAKIALGIGRERLYRFLRRFGFGVRTGVLLPGETPGQLRPYTRWYDVDLATIGFGQGVSVNTLQLAAATAAIANGGRLMQPIVVRRVVDPEGRTLRDFPPTARRQVIPPEIARTVADMMTAVTEEGGTGLDAAVDGYTVAAKTGTAQKVDYVSGGYTEDAWTASIVGFVPAERPRLAIAVVIDEPIVSHTGGSVAAPVFRHIATAALRYLGVAPTSGARIAMARLDEHVDRARSTARPPPEPPAALAAEPAAATPGQIPVPSLLGLSLRNALRTAARAGFDVESLGSGRAVEQDPAPGALVGTPLRVRVRFAAPRVDREEREGRERVLPDEPGEPPVDRAAQAPSRAPEAG